MGWISPLFGPKNPQKCQKEYNTSSYWEKYHSQTCIRNCNVFILFWYNQQSKKVLFVFFENKNCFSFFSIERFLKSNHWLQILRQKHPDDSWLNILLLCFEYLKKLIYQLIKIIIDWSWRIKNNNYPLISNSHLDPDTLKAHHYQPKKCKHIVNVKIVNKNRCYLGFQKCAEQWYLLIEMVDLYLQKVN